MFWAHPARAQRLGRAEMVDVKIKRICRSRCDTNRHDHGKRNKATNIIVFLKGKVCRALSGAG